MNYIKEVFDPVNLPHAMHIVLTSDPDNPDKFVNETHFFLETIHNLDIINKDDTILDFGCGMGRISGPLVHNFGCKVIGVDISERMRQFASLYVRSPNNFSAVEFYTKENTIDGAICTFVLQHVENPTNEILNLSKIIKNNGYLIVVNEDIRFVPAEIGAHNFIVWNDDKFDVFGEIEKYFVLEKSIPYMETKKFIKVYRKKQT